MKPDWGKAPEWANWAWVGLSGYWFYSYKKPKWSWFTFSWNPPKCSAWSAVLPVPIVLEYGWRVRRKSLEPRP